MAYRRPQCQKIAQKSSTEKGIQHHNEARAAGFSSSGRLDMALTEFVDTHMYAFHSLARAYVLQRGGAEWSQKPLKMLTFILTSTASLGSHPNPARTFKIKSHNFVSLDEYFAHYPWCRRDWDGIQRERDAVTAEFAHQDLFVGTMPVRFCVEGVDVSHMLFFPQYLDNPRHRKDSDRALERYEHGASEITVKSALLADVIVLLRGSINQGFPLRNVEGEHQLITLPGRYVRLANGNWTWEALFTKWKDYERNVHKGLDATLDRLWIGAPPDELMVLFGYW